jgi:hypothetical protein
MNNNCRFIVLISLIANYENLFASAKNLSLKKPLKRVEHKDFDIECSCSSGDEKDTPPGFSQPKSTVLQQTVAAKDFKNNSPVQQIKLRHIEEIDARVAYGSADESLSLDDDSLLSPMTSLSDSVIYPKVQRGSWCDELSPDSDAKKDSGLEPELLSTSRFVYPNLNEIKPYVSQSLRELQDIADEDL